MTCLGDFCHHQGNFGYIHEYSTYNFNEDHIQPWTIAPLMSSVWGDEGTGSATKCLTVYSCHPSYSKMYVVAICNSFTHTMRWRPKDRKNNGHFARRNLDCVGLSATFFFLTPVESPSSQFCPVVVRPARPSALGNFPTFTLRVEPVRARKPSRCFLEGFEWHFGSVVAADGVLLRQYILQYNVYCFSLGFENSDCTVILCNALHSNYCLY